MIRSFMSTPAGTMLIGENARAGGSSGDAEVARDGVEYARVGLVRHELRCRYSHGRFTYYWRAGR